MGFCLLCYVTVKFWYYSKGSVLNLKGGRTESRALENSKLLETLISESFPKGPHLNTKSRPTKRLESYSARCITSNLQQNRNINLSIGRQTAQSHYRPTETTEHIIGYGTDFQSEKIQHYPSQHRNNSMPSQKPSQSTAPMPPMKGKCHK